jgi:hypothetical protein
MITSVLAREAIETKEESMQDLPKGGQDLTGAGGGESLRDKKQRKREVCIK